MVFVSNYFVVLGWLQGNLVQKALRPCMNGSRKDPLMLTCVPSQCRIQHTHILPADVKA
jgi:hypothetical protein